MTTLPYSNNNALGAILVSLIISQAVGLSSTPSIAKMNRARSMLFAASCPSSPPATFLTAEACAIDRIPEAISNGTVATSSTRSFTKLSLDAALLARYACKKFQRFDGKESDPASASLSDPTVITQALRSLELARQAPSAFNIQPYKFVLVHTPEQKLALSRYCLGPNAARVRDSDCSVVFLADKQVLRTLPEYCKFMSKLYPDRSEKKTWKQKRQALISQFYIAVFSSGLPLPRILASSISFLFRSAMAFLNCFTNQFYPMPSLSSAETWATKQVSLVAMAYMLACTSRGLATIPMEGINAGGIRRMLQIPRRYAIPLVISTGKPYVKEDHASRLRKATSRRYPTEHVIYANIFGQPIQLNLAK